MKVYSTKQRKSLSDYLLSHRDEEMTAAEIAAALRGEGISLSAVYRNLASLEEEGLVQRITRAGDRKIFFRFSGAEECREHIHLRCRKCGKTFHMDMGTTDLLDETVAENCGFKMDRAETVINGVCGDCGKAEQTSKK